MSEVNVLGKEKDEYLFNNFAYPGKSGELETKDGAVVSKSKYVKVDGSYVQRESIIAGIVRHKGRLAQAIQKEKQSRTPRARQSELKAARTEQQQERARAKQEAREDRQYWKEKRKALNLTAENYDKKVKAVLSKGGYKRVGAITWMRPETVAPRAFVDGYGMYATIDGIRWFKLDEEPTRFIRHRSPVHENTRGDAFILIPEGDMPDYSKSKLAGDRLTVSGVTEEEFRLALATIRGRRARKHE